MQEAELHTHTHTFICAEATEDKRNTGTVASRWQLTDKNETTINLNHLQHFCVLNIEVWRERKYLAREAERVPVPCVRFKAAIINLSASHQADAVPRALYNQDVLEILS